MQLILWLQNSSRWTTKAELKHLCYLFIKCR